MGNQWFRFKQFEIQQDECAMKVGTDGVILGAWTNLEHAKKVLDIGTGTGLLALMLAQRSSLVEIDAIEIENRSAMQAASNFSASNFSSRIRCIEISFDKFLKLQDKPLYDLIICNPPYFSDSLRPPGKERSMARHDDTLSLPELIEGAAAILVPEGKLSLVLPAELKEISIELAGKHKLFSVKELYIKPTPEKEIKRICLEFSFEADDRKEETLVIEEGGRHIYSASYIELTRDFYLDF